MILIFCKIAQLSACIITMFLLKKHHLNDNQTKHSNLSCIWLLMFELVGMTVKSKRLTIGFCYPYVSYTGMFQHLSDWCWWSFIHIHWRIRNYWVNTASPITINFPLLMYLEIIRFLLSLFYFVCLFSFFKWAHTVVLKIINNLAGASQ